MKIEIIRSPSAGFLQMILANVRPADRQQLEDRPWGAIGLVQAKLIDLYRSADLAAKASNVMTALVLGNCPQHTQLLLIAGKEAAVQAALDKIRSCYRPLQR